MEDYKSTLARQVSICTGNLCWEEENQSSDASAHLIMVC